ncbi:MAG TPA: nitroreductase family protein [Candidatus Limnocylindria bacterium]|nr:nitroreductase family protein [Candidatus Limnocylindria bacterium]
MSQPVDLVRPLLRVRQVREFTDAAVDDAKLDALADAGRWSGSARNSQPWRFIVVTDPGTLRAMADAGMPQTRSLATAPTAIAIVMPRDEDRSAVSQTYDEGRAAERILVAATLLGLGAGIAWVRSDVREAMGGLLNVPEDRYVRTIVAVGYPTDAAKRPKTAPGEARLPRSEMVFRERWPS